MSPSSWNLQTASACTCTRRPAPFGCIALRSTKRISRLKASDDDDPDLNLYYQAAGVKKPPQGLDEFVRRHLDLGESFDGRKLELRYGEHTVQVKLQVLKEGGRSKASDSERKVLHIPSAEQEDWRMFMILSGDGEPYTCEDYVYHYFMMLAYGWTYGACMRTEEYYIEAAQELGCDIEELVEADKAYGIYTGKADALLQAGTGRLEDGDGVQMQQ